MIRCKMRQMRLERGMAGSRQFLILAETLNSILKVMRSIDGLLSGKSKIKVATGCSVEDRL